MNNEILEISKLIFKFLLKVFAFLFILIAISVIFVFCFLYFKTNSEIKNAERTFKINAQAYLEEALRNYEIDYGRLPKFLSEVDSNCLVEPNSGSSNVVKKYDGTGGWVYDPLNRVLAVNLNIKRPNKKMDFQNIQIIPNPIFGRIWFLNDLKFEAYTNSSFVNRYEKDERGRSVSIEYSGKEKSSLFSIEYRYDEDDRISQRIVSAAGKTNLSVYSYNPSGKLTHEKSAGKETEYSYDERGNRIQKQIISGGNTNSTKYEYQWYKSQMVENTYTYLPISNEEFETDPYALTLKNILTQWSQDGDSGEYSNTKDTLEYVNRIVRKSDALTPPGEWYVQWGNIDYSFNKTKSPVEGFKEIGLEQKGERIPIYLALVGGKSRRFEGDQWRYFTSRGGRIVNEMDAEGKVIRTYQYDPDLGELLSFSDMGAEGEKERTYFCITDLQGSILGLMAGEEIIETYEYDSFGNVVSVRDASGSEIQKSAVGNIHLWQGAEYFWEARLYNFYGRLYDPETGRWLTEHPLDALGHWVNYYPFCFNDPVNKIWRWLPKDSALLKNRNNDSTHEQQLQNVETLR